MSEQRADRQDIADLMTGWMHRDLGQWDQLRALFTPDARIEITWFTGLASDFVSGSMRMGTSDLLTKHVIASPVVTFSADGECAVSETNAIIIAQHRRLQVGCQAHSRFIDRLVRSEGRWRIADRKSVYDLASFSYPAGVVDLDPDLLARHPSEYAALAYVLVNGGFPVTGTFPTRGSDAEREISESAALWLTTGQAGASA